MSANAKVAAAKATTARAAPGKAATARTPAAKKTITTTGRCQCRAIEYQFTGEPKWVMHCHCESCRRAVSSAVATYVGVRLEQFSYLKGEPTVYESSPGVKRYFCTSCGSPMAYAGAFSVTSVSMGDIDANHNQLVTAVRRGDILLFRGWFNAPENAKVTAIYNEAFPPAPVA